MSAAAVMYLNGADPVGVPYLAARTSLERDVWAAITVRANQMITEARAG